MAVPDRLTVVERVYHQPGGEEAICELTRFTRLLSTNEQVYTRKGKVEQEWKPLDVGWFSESCCGLLLLSNLEGEFPDRIPTPEEKSDVAARILEVSFGPLDGPEFYAHCIVLPKESLRIHPARVNRIAVRSKHGTVHYRTCIYPA